MSANRFIYFGLSQDDCAIKIGSSIRPISRMKHFELTPLGVILMDDIRGNLENRIHQQFAHFRHSGMLPEMEWYHPHEDILKFISVNCTLVSSVIDCRRDKPSAAWLSATQIQMAIALYRHGATLRYIASVMQFSHTTIRNTLVVMPQFNHWKAANRELRHANMRSGKRGFTDDFLKKITTSEL